MQQLASRLKKPMPERQFVKVVKKGLRDGIARYVYAMDVLTVDELREECVEVKRSFGRRGHAVNLQQSKLRVSEAYRTKSTSSETWKWTSYVGESEIHSGQVAGIAGLRSTDSRIARLRSGGGFVSGAASWA